FIQTFMGRLYLIFVFLSIGFISLSNYSKNSNSSPRGGVVRLSVSRRDGFPFVFTTLVAKSNYSKNSNSSPRGFVVGDFRFRAGTASLLCLRPWWQNPTIRKIPIVAPWFRGEREKGEI
ncbi:MAG: hypothetical protein IIW10_06545, partial [Spirochaetaceae bacterium]|nr:hypothetical protein [Spirochaetaceae bacterium]